MTVKEAIAIITAPKNNLIRIKQLSPKLGNKHKEWRKRWTCKHHNRVHKYTFYTHVEIPAGIGLARMYGVDTKKELFELAKTFQS